MGSTTVRAGLRGQLSAAGILIGCVGCVIISASAAPVKLSSLAMARKYLNTRTSIINSFQPGTYAALLLHTIPINSSNR